MKEKENAVTFPPGTPLVLVPLAPMDTLMPLITLQTPKIHVTKNMPYINHIRPSVQ